jgi:hypothetical protein
MYSIAGSNDPQHLPGDDEFEWVNVQTRRRLRPDM